MKTFQIRYTTYANPDLIKSCFANCKPAAKKRLREWMENDDKKRITLTFKDGTKVQLEKEQVGGKILE